MQNLSLFYYLTLILIDLEKCWKIKTHSHSAFQWSSEGPADYLELVRKGVMGVHILTFSR